LESVFTAKRELKAFAFVIVSPPAVKLKDEGVTVPLVPLPDKISGGLTMFGGRGCGTVKEPVSLVLSLRGTLVKW